MTTRIFITLTLLLFAKVAVAQDTLVASSDSVAVVLPVAAETAAAKADTPAAALEADSVAKPEKLSLYQKVIRYFDESNKPKANPNSFDISFIGGPYYSDETSVALGIVAQGNYRLKGASDSIYPSSFVALSAKASVTGFVELGVYGTNIFHGDKWRINYDFNFMEMPTDYWGIGYEMAADDANKTKYRNINFIMRAEGLRRIGSHIYVGPSLQFATGAVRHPADSAMWAGQPLRPRSVGAGLSFIFDSRDNLTAPTRGLYLNVSQEFMPRFLGNEKWGFSFSEITASAYQKVWKGGILAERLHGRWAYGNVPWNMMSTLGGSHSMRGYYEGQYRDKFEADATVELRQHVWRRNGIVVWGGLAAIAPNPGKVRFSQLLPNCGIGYRWEFKKYTNVRVDVGFGRHCKGFSFSINEAF